MIFMLMIFMIYTARISFSKDSQIIGRGLDSWDFGLLDF